jgi:hypothetical protein
VGLLVEHACYISQSGSFSQLFTQNDCPTEMLIRVGTEDTIWKYPNSDELLESNLQMFQTAKEIARLHGRRVATAEEYRQILGLANRVQTGSMRGQAPD